MKITARDREVVLIKSGATCDEGRKAAKPRADAMRLPNGLTMAEMAERLRVSESTVRRRWDRVKAGELTFAQAFKAPPMSRSEIGRKARTLAWDKLHSGGRPL